MKDTIAYRGAYSVYARRALDASIKMTRQRALFCVGFGYGESDF